MDSALSAEYKRRWDTAGWCVIEGVVPLDVLAAAQEALPSVVPTAEEFASGVDPDRNAPFLTERGAPRPQFPFERGGLNRVALHDLILDLAERFLTVDDFSLYQASVIAPYSTPAHHYEQLLHVYYATHTL